MNLYGILRDLGRNVESSFEWDLLPVQGKVQMLKQGVSPEVRSQAVGKCQKTVAYGRFDVTMVPITTVYKMRAIIVCCFGSYSEFFTWKKYPMQGRFDA